MPGRSVTGRFDRPVEFGYKAQVAGNDDGITLVEYGAPDGPQLVATPSGPPGALAAFAAKPTATGSSRRQIVRMLPRDIARRLYPASAHRHRSELP